MLLAEIFPTSHIKPDVAARTKGQLFEELIDFLSAAQPIPNRAAILEGLWKRERMLNTVIAPSIALPHASLRGHRRPLGVFGISQAGIDYGAEDGKPVHVVLMLIDDWYETRAHLAILRNAARMIGSPNFFSKVMRCTTAPEVFAVITEIEEMQSP
jgi:PTS system fructose-specific IIC component